MDLQRRLSEYDTAVANLDKDILKGFKYRAASSTVAPDTLKLTVSWRSSPPAVDDMSTAYAETIAIIKAQAARVRQDQQQPVSGQPAERSPAEDAEMGSTPSEDSDDYEKFSDSELD